jgi:hypothetical protein
MADAEDRSRRTGSHADREREGEAGAVSVRIMTLVWQVDLPDSEKIVLLALADCANDEGGCWPSIATIARKCSKSERTVQSCIRSLESNGHLTRIEARGKGCNYTIHPRSRCTPAAAAPPQGLPLTPAAAAPKPSRTVKPQKATPSSARATKQTTVPANFKPDLKGKTGETVAAWPVGRLDEEVEAFIDHHTAKGSLSKCWQASWRTWVRNSRKWDERDGLRAKLRMGGNQPDTLLAALEIARAEERAEACSGSYQADDPGAWGAVSARLIGHA